ncbi:TetR family transcriptional regulator [Streptococcus downei]|uniref:TetR family transcriptional regulator n=1 Tax=Streptococcus downei MFe28 TaxID=764290 RepID=A0A380JD43_STRDO|nr:TetR family transcriptional regulator [Streptococcus downei]EFQ56855.1 transcriptional regulator, TetR family [Streptococcus downei F0415]SUN35317.1 TetR family transcriptional regulator [Streptococcus downei MFe28]
MKKQDRRFKRTQKVIYNSFSNLLLEKDFTSITVNDISQQADINRSTFYLHFEDKYALFEAYLTSLLPIASEIHFTQTISQQELLCRGLGELYDYLETNDLFLKRLFNEENYPFTLKALRPALKNFFDNNQDVFSEKMAHSRAFTAHIRIANLVAMVEWYLAQNDYSRDRFIEETYELISKLDNFNT